MTGHHGLYFQNFKGFWQSYSLLFKHEPTWCHRWLSNLMRSWLSGESRFVPLGHSYDRPKLLEIDLLSQKIFAIISTRAAHL